MRKTKKLTLGAVISAMSVAFMALGAYVEVLDLSVLALISLLVAFMCIEVGAPYNWLVLAVTSTLGGIFFTTRVIWLTYLFIFGLYPILKGFIERTKRGFWIPLKLLAFNLMLPPVAILTELITGIPFFNPEKIVMPAGVNPYAVTAVVYAVCIAALMLYD